MKTLQTKQEEAIVRQAAHDQRTLSEQLELIRTRPGSSNRESLRILELGMVPGTMNKTFAELRVRT